MLKQANRYINLSDPANPKETEISFSVTGVPSIAFEKASQNSAAGLSDRLAAVAEEVFSAYRETIERLGDS